MFTITVQGETYTYDDVSDFRDDWRFSELERIEDLTGKTWEESYQAFVAGSRRAARAILYVRYCRDHPDAKWSDFDPDERTFTLRVKQPEQPAEPDPTPAGGDEPAGS